MDIGELVNRLDRVLHEPTRLGIAVELVGGPKCFADLKTILNSSDGNLSVHGKKLEESGYIAITKQFVGKIPQTTFHLTDHGRDALRHYAEDMDAVITLSQRDDHLEVSGAVRLYQQRGPDHVLGA